ncbi:MAG: tetratricopeptide repeat protein [Chlamydiales bacterium]|nr:tetratricopeptide repeat protein [Chlamydiales bacterium]
MNQKELENKVLEDVSKLKGAFQDVALNLAHVLADVEMQAPNQLLPKTLFLEKFQQLLLDELAGTHNRIQNGTLAIVQAATQMQVGAEIDPDLSAGLDKLADLCTLITNDRQAFIEALVQDKSLQQIAGITDAVLEKIYQCAKYHYDQEHFQEASDAFCVLTILQPQNPVFWLGLGNSEYHLKNYDEALHAYAFVSRCNPDDYYSHIYACRCYEAQEDLENAINELQLALFVLNNNPEEKELQLTLELQVKRLELAVFKRGE